MSQGEERADHSTPVGDPAAAQCDAVQRRAFRRLAAILSADVVGYSALMGRDEEGTLSRVKSLVHDIIEPALARHEGHLVKTMGDGVLADFPSVFEAFHAASEMQQSLQGDSGAKDENRLHLRIGINIGDVIYDDGDVFGDGVNIAARLQSIADADSICVSSRAWEDLRRLDLEFEDRGELKLKNIDNPIHVFSVATDSARRSTKRRPGKPAAPEESLPSIAVLPIVDLSPGADKSYFADGLQDALITELAKIGGLRVISRTSTLQYAATTKSVPEIARELGVRNVIEATVLCADKSVRIQMQLIGAAPRETHLWADSFDGEMGKILDLHSKVVGAVAANVGACLTTADLRRLSLDRREVEPEVYDNYLRGRALIRSHTPEGFAKGVDLIESAIAQDPGNPMLYEALALAHSDLAHLPAPPADAFPKATHYAHRALALDGQAAGAHLALAEATMYHDWDLVAADAALTQALSLDPNSARGHSHRGWLYDAQGKLDEAERAFLESIRVGPGEPLLVAWYGWWLEMCGRFDEAARYAEDSLRLAENFPVGLYVLGNANRELGKLDEAYSVHAKLAADNPMFDDGLAVTCVAMGRGEEAEQIVARLDGDTPWETWCRALILGYMGRTDAAFEALMAAVRHRHSFIPWIHRFRQSESLRDDPRFEVLNGLVKHGA